MNFSKNVKKEIIEKHLTSSEKYDTIEGIILSIFDGKCKNAEIKIMDKDIYAFVKSVIHEYIESRELAKISYKMGVIKFTDICNIDFEIYSYIDDINFNKPSDINRISNFIKGVFIIDGTIINPEKYYRAEINLRTEFLRLSLPKIFKRLNIKHTIIKKEHTNILTIADSDSLSDFLKLIQSTTSLYALEDIKIIKSYREETNRKINSETANINKIVAASQKHINAINILKEKNKFKKLNKDLIDIAILREQHPEVSLSELAELSDNEFNKSKIVRCLNKIVKLSEDE